MLSLDDPRIDQWVAQASQQGRDDGYSVALEVIRISLSHPRVLQTTLDEPRTYDPPDLSGRWREFIEDLLPDDVILDDLPEVVTDDLVQAYEQSAAFIFDTTLGNPENVVRLRRQLTEPDPQLCFDLNYLELDFPDPPPALPYVGEQLSFEL